MASQMYAEFIHYAEENVPDYAGRLESLKAGIKSYLAEKDLLAGPHADDKDRIYTEMLMFVEMPVETFCTYFENYETRREIETACSLFDEWAVARAFDNKTITPGKYQQELAEFLTLTSKIGLDKRYREWTDRKTHDAIMSLKYAAKMSNEVNESVAETISRMSAQ